jgi:hypothetical protein
MTQKGSILTRDAHQPSTTPPGQTVPAAGPPEHLSFRERAKERGSDALITSVLLLACFAAFLTLLSVSFPEGTSLKNLIRPAEVASLRTSRDVEVDFDEDRRTGVATLHTMTNKVKHKEADGIAWKDSETGMVFGGRSSVQTLEHSTAEITFDERNSLHLRENSLVVLKSVDERPDGSDRRASVLVLEGDLQGTLRASSDDSLSVDVETSHGVARILPSGTRGAPTEFRVKVNDDESSNIVVQGGRAEIATEHGTLVVEGNRLVTLSENAAPRVDELPPAPRVLSPENGQTFRFRAQVPQVDFRWEKSSGSQGYTLLVARDSRFEKIELEIAIDDPEFVHGNLAPGDYYWKVAGKKRGVEGLASPPRRLHLVRDADAPALRIQWPGDPVTTSTVALTGETEPGSQVFIANEAVAVTKAGAFAHRIELEQGVNVVVIEAIDGAGNSSYASHALFARY